MRNEQSLNRAAGPSGHHHPQMQQQARPRQAQAYYAAQSSPFAGQMGAQVSRLVAAGAQAPRQAVIGVILTVALLAFEIFNYDTTRFALQNLLGPINFAGIAWASILAIAFCSIDFAGLVRLFTPERGKDEPKEVWYLMGAWLLGATMNAMMTWWAVSLTLLNHDFGNEVLSRDQLLTIVPVFVAVLVWLTRILFIGAFTVAGEKLLDFRGKQPSMAAQPAVQPQAVASRAQALPEPLHYEPTSDEVPGFLMGNSQRGQRPSQPQKRNISAAPVHPPQPPQEPVYQQQEPLNLTTPAPQPARNKNVNDNRVRQRPPMPNAPAAPTNGVRRTPLTGGIQARGGKIEG